MTVGVQVSFDASDPARLGAFWAELLGYIEQPPPEGFGSWQEALVAWGVPEDQRDSAYAIVDPAGRAPRMFFQRVPEAKSAKNRMHLDIVSPDIEAEAARLTDWLGPLRVTPRFRTPLERELVA